MAADGDGRAPARLHAAADSPPARSPGVPAAPLLPGTPEPRLAGVRARLAWARPGWKPPRGEGLPAPPLARTPAGRGCGAGGGRPGGPRPRPERSPPAEP